MSENYDRYPGMDRPITRRDFLNGAAVVIGGALFAGTTLGQGGPCIEPSNQADAYPPALTGLRGSHPGSFETAHSLRDGTFWKTAPAPADTPEVYDLVVVGAGISRLSAAHFFRERVGKSSRILLLENHDDFGGHAKRNEFHLGGKLQLCNGGTLLIDSPTPYSPEADGLLKKQGIDPPKLEETTADRRLYPSLGLKPALFERKTRDEIARILSPGGFEPAEDIQAITINRWPHGYGYEYNPLFDANWPEAERPNVIGRKKFGRIAIANTDSGATEYTDVAIDQAYRAVQELVTI